MQLLPNYENCIICGCGNPAGVHARFYRKGDRVIGQCTFEEKHAGYKGLVHGGMLSALLDEALGRIVTGITGKLVVTGKLSLRFHRPVPVGTKVEFYGEMDREQRKPGLFHTASGKITDEESGKVYTSANGTFFAIPEEDYPQILPTLNLEDNDRPVTMEDM